MSDRIFGNGKTTMPDRSRQQFNGQQNPVNQLRLEQDAVGISIAVKAKVESCIKRSPATSLLIAVAAGLTIGWLVKR